MGCEVSLHLQVIIDDLLQHVLFHEGKPHTIAELVETLSAGADHEASAALNSLPLRMHSLRSTTANHEQPYPCRHVP
jgi:hypothetical protein